MGSTPPTSLCRATICRRAGHCPATARRHCRGRSGAANNAWQALKIGAGGWLTGIDIAPDGTMVVRTDTYGAYIWNGTQWQQLVTRPACRREAASAAPRCLRNPNCSQQYQYSLHGISGLCLRSTDKGTSWTKTAFAQVTEDPERSLPDEGQKMAIDPNNPNVVYVGTPQNGLFVTTDGGASWQKRSAVPVSGQDAAATIRALPASPLTRLRASAGAKPTPSSPPAMATVSLRAPTAAPRGPLERRPERCRIRRDFQLPASTMRSATTIPHYGAI